MLIADLLDLILPSSCVACGNPMAALCPSCAPRGELVSREIRGVTVTAAGEYRDGLRAGLLAYKERNRRDLAEPLGELLARAVDGLGGEGYVLTPVPSARRSARGRGGDHMFRLGRVAARCGARQLRPLLTLTRSVQDSAGLDVVERRRNLALAIRARSPRAGERGVVIVDDIVTSGATVAEAARALTAAGWHVRGAAAVASTPLQ